LNYISTMFSRLDAVYKNVAVSALSNNITKSAAAA
jgi:hypothetical protein